MKKQVKALAGAIVLSLLISTVLSSQTVSSINGLAFADYYYKVSGHSGTDKQNGFEFRRIYLTFENQITEKIKIRFRLESASQKYGSSGKINPFVKHAYLEWSDLIPGHKLYLGIAETNAFKNAEQYWGYRPIEKTIMDLEKISSSADMGIAVKGDISGLLHHWLTIFNGPGYGSPETDPFKKFGYALWITPLRGLIIEGYMDYEKQNPDNPDFEYATDYYGSSGYTTMKGFVGYDAPAFTIGAELFSRTNLKSGAGNASTLNRVDVQRMGYSLFGSWITPLPKLKIYARYDYYDPNTGDSVISDTDGTTGLDDEHRLVIAGLDYIPAANVHIMPNLMIKSFSRSGSDPELTARMTLYYKFDSGKIIVE